MKLKEILKLIAAGASGVIAHHYGSQLLSKLDDRFTNATTAEDNKEVVTTAVNSPPVSVDTEGTYMPEIRELLRNLHKDCSQMRDRGFSEEKNEIFSKLVETVDETDAYTKTLIEILLKKEDSLGIEIQKKINSNVEKLSSILEDINKSGNNLIPDFIWNLDITKLYGYLDTLTLQQEGALFHLVVLLTILMIVFNILGIFFGNEIIKYFNIENKFPSLSNFFKLRAELQRYYLMWNITILFVLSIGALGINILVFNLG